MAMTFDEAVAYLKKPIVITSIFNRKTRDAIKVVLSRTYMVDEGEWGNIRDKNGYETDKWRCTGCDNIITEEDPCLLPNYCPECGNDKRKWLKKYLDNKAAPYMNEASCHSDAITYRMQRFM